MTDSVVWRPFSEVLAEPLRNGLTRPKAVRGVGTKMVNMGELFAHHRIGTVPMERVQLSQKEARDFLLRPLDLLFARQSLVLAGAGKCSVFMAADEPVTFEGHIIRARLNSDVAAPLFYYYLFNSPPGRRLIESIVEQVAAAGIRGSDLSKLKVPYPPLPTQRAIARILGALDDKIELNRRMNETLEAIARAIFKSWFIDFDPVRAKAAGRQPAGMDAATAALFPDGFDDSALGEIPTGWSEGSILQIADLLSGGTPKTSVAEYWDGGIPWVSAKDVGNANGLFIMDTEKTISQAGLENSSTKILPAKTTVVTARGTVGSYGLLSRAMAMNQTNYGLKARSNSFDYYVYFSLVALVEHLKQHAYGTIFDTVTTKTFEGTLTALADAPIVEAFHNLAAPFMDKILANQQESRTLAAIRDALLPKLLSGEIRVNDTEKALEATT